MCAVGQSGQCFRVPRAFLFQFSLFPSLFYFKTVFILKTKSSGVVVTLHFHKVKLLSCKETGELGVVGGLMGGSEGGGLVGSWGGGGREEWILGVARDCILFQRERQT